MTLSGEPWIDVIQNNRYARSVGSTDRSDCRGCARASGSIATPFVLQLSGVASELVVVAISARE